MTIPACPTCSAELGPWEADRCLAHPRPVEPDWMNDLLTPSWSIADQAVLALEREASVISIYDIGRAIAREFGREVQQVSLTALVGTDRRFCWSGKGLYGLFRHTRIPGERTLAGVSRFVLAAHGAPMSIPSLSFALKQSGYRFQDISLENALHRDAPYLGFRFAYSGFPDYATVVSLDDLDKARAIIVRSLQIDDPYNGLWPAAELLDRWGLKVGAAIEERRRRLDAAATDSVE